MTGNDPTSPADELERALQKLRGEAETLGVLLQAEMTLADAEQQVAERRAWIDALDRGALVDLAEWARVDLDDQPTNAEIVQRVLLAELQRYDTLSLRGLRVLAKLRNVAGADTASRKELERRLRRAESFRETVRRKRRQIMGSILSRALESAAETPQPMDERKRDVLEASLKRHIQEQGVVGGLATKLRGVADDYVAQKLDEIELRIDRKLEEIDQRLAEWRDREISNRLKIIKITLIASILVALISLGYDCLRSPAKGPEPPVQQQRAP